MGLPGFVRKSYINLFIQSLNDVIIVPLTQMMNGRILPYRGTAQKMWWDLNTGSLASNKFLKVTSEWAQ